MTKIYILISMLFLSISCYAQNIPYVDLLNMPQNQLIKNKFHTKNNDPFINILCKSSNKRGNKYDIYIGYGETGVSYLTYSFYDNNKYLEIKSFIESECDIIKNENSDIQNIIIGQIDGYTISLSYTIYNVKNGLNLNWGYGISTSSGTEKKGVSYQYKIETGIPYCIIMSDRKKKRLEKRKSKEINLDYNYTKNE